MNLNDVTQYRAVIFKRRLYYTVPSPVSIREVFFKYTKDGVKPLLGIQEIFLLDEDAYNELIKNNVFRRAEVAKIAKHSFTVKGYRNNQSKGRSSEF